MAKPESRRAYVAAEVITGLAHQIRVLRLQRKWTQQDLARQLGTTQAAISRLEDPSYGKANLKTLLEISGVFDVALTVKFSSFTRFLQSSFKLRREDLEVEPFEEEKAHVTFIASSASRYFNAEITDSSVLSGWISKPYEPITSNQLLFISDSQTYSPTLLALRSGSEKSLLTNQVFLSGGLPAPQKSGS